MQSGNHDWQSRKGWESAQIRSNAKRGVYGFWFMAVFWNAISTPVLFAIPDELKSGNWAILVALLFPIAGLFIIYKAVQATRAYRHYGQVLLELDPYPAAIGGHMGATVDISRLAYSDATAAESDILVKLECVYSYVSGSGKNRSRRERIQWAEQGRPHIGLAGQGTRLSFRFDVPEGLPEADVEQSGEYHFWRLTLKVDIDGVDLERHYNIPAFSSSEQSRHIRYDLSQPVREERERESEEARMAIASGQFDIPGLSRAMQYEDFGSSIKMVFPMFRNKVLSLVAAVFAGGFSFASYKMIELASDGGAFGIFIALFCLPFAIVAVISTLVTLYLPFNRLVVTIDAQGIKALRSWMYIPIKIHRRALSEIKNLNIKRTGSTGEGVDKIEHYKVLATDQKGQTIPIALDLDGRDVSQHFCDYLAKRIGVVVKQDTPKA
ncbi:conserved hypothetical protein [gamma proteobacterium HTCC5015]|nr:conserved hypothetical protein [gamma proteobacterium HTCC5015]